MADKQISFKINDDLHRKIKIRAIVENLQLKDWVTRLLIKAVEKEPKNGKLV